MSALFCFYICHFIYLLVYFAHKSFFFPKQSYISIKKKKNFFLTDAA